VYIMLKLFKKFACNAKHEPCEQNDKSKACADREKQDKLFPVANNDSNSCVQIFKDVDIRRDFDLKGLIGFPGSFGEVRVAVELSSGKGYAVKMMKLHKYTSSVIRSEIAIMKTLRNPNLASMISVYECKKRVYLVMEKYDGGDLYDLVVSQGGRLEHEPLAVAVVKQILLGLQHLHSRHIAHCDIKLCNIMLSSSKQVKIIDFGVSQIVEEGQMLSSEAGSPSFIAPEVLMGSYNEFCDMWSLGCVVFILLLGFNPFNPKAVAALPNKEKICENILKGFCPDSKVGYGAWFPKAIAISDLAKDFISNLLVSDWRHRMSASEALRHPWIQQSFSN